MYTACVSRQRVIGSETIGRFDRGPTDTANDADGENGRRVSATVARVSSVSSSRGDEGNVEAASRSDIYATTRVTRGRTRTAAKLHNPLERPAEPPRRGTKRRKTLSAGRSHARPDESDAYAANTLHTYYRL